MYAQHTTLYVQCTKTLFVQCTEVYKHGILIAVQNEVAVTQASPGAAASAPAEGLPPGMSVSVVVTPSTSSAAAPLVVEASPSPGRRLLADTVASDGTGVDANMTITAPAADMSNITSLVRQAVNSGSLQSQLHMAGGCQQTSITHFLFWTVLAVE